MKKIILMMLVLMVVLGSVSVFGLCEEHHDEWDYCGYDECLILRGTSQWTKIYHDEFGYECLAVPFENDPPCDCMRLI